MASTSNFSLNQTTLSDDEEDIPKFAGGKDAVIVVIDCNSSMFTRLDPGSDDEENSVDVPKCLFDRCLYVIEKYMLQKINNDHNNLVS